MINVKMISAVSENGIIGNSLTNSIPWSYKEDMKFFREMTKDSIVIMGRKTYESIGKPLPNRRNIVVSRIAKAFNLSLFDGVEIASSLKNAIDLCENDNKTIWLIGGSSIYQAGLDYADEIYLTLIPKYIDDGNAIKFPWINPAFFSVSHYKKLSDELDVIQYIRDK